MKEEQAEKLLSAACEFQGKSMAAREKCRDEFRKRETDSENVLRITLDGLIGDVTKQIARKIDATNDGVSYQLGVSASYIRTHFLVTDFILNGDLVEALVLIRKQLESLARLHELDSKPFQKLTGNVPNIKNVLKGEAGRLYGDLSEVAHFSRPRVTDLLSVFEEGDLVGPCLFPQYSERSAACMDMNSFVAIYFLAWITEKLETWYPDYDSAEDKELFAYCVRLALDCEVIRLADDESE